MRIGRIRVEFERTETLLLRRRRKIVRQSQDHRPDRPADDARHDVNEVAQTTLVGDERDDNQE